MAIWGQVNRRGSTPYRADVLGQPARMWLVAKSGRVSRLRGPKPKAEETAPARTSRATRIAAAVSEPAEVAAIAEASVSTLGDDSELKVMLAELGRRRAWGQITLQEFEAQRARLAAPEPAGHPAAADDRRLTLAPVGPVIPRSAEHWSTWGAASDGARIVLTGAQRLVLVLIALFGVLLIVRNPRSGLIACFEFMTLLYFGTGLYKLWLLVRGERGLSDRPRDPVRIADADLPRYTVLVPLHREGRILPLLVKRLQSIDYPAERLEILLLIEVDDQETRKAVRSYPLPAHFRPMIMPPGQPRTKPRALNIGLQAATGEFIVIYDAEDHPERDQLRKAVAAFRRLPANVVCIQGRLNFYNRFQTLLTRLFAVDYAVWYEQFLPGLTRSRRLPSGSFVPLGGTSNHFRVDALRHVGGWDPFNVTEDCDLGARLGRKGLRVAMLDSITWEEAVPHVKPWIRQRSRWVKGYMQTYLVHMRHPIRLWQELGTRSFLDFQMLVGGSSLILLLNPVMWLLTALYMATKGTHLGAFIESLYPVSVYYPALISLVIGNFILFYCNAYVCVRHRFIDLTRYTLLVPVYWVLLSLGAWAGLISLVRDPFYWAKTEHGASLASAAAPAAVMRYATTEPS